MHKGSKETPHNMVNFVHSSSFNHPTPPLQGGVESGGTRDPIDFRGNRLLGYTQLRYQARDGRSI